jgi:hypothetical protein
MPVSGRGTPSASRDRVRTEGLAVVLLHNSDARVHELSPSA